MQPQVVELPGLPAHPVRAVGEHDRRYPGGLERLGGPEIAAGQQLAEVELLSHAGRCYGERGRVFGAGRSPQLIVGRQAPGRITI